MMVQSLPFLDENASASVDPDPEHSLLTAHWQCQGEGRQTPQEYLPDSNEAYGPPIFCDARALNSYHEVFLDDSDFDT